MFKEMLKEQTARGIGDAVGAVGTMVAFAVIAAPIYGVYKLGCFVIDKVDEKKEKKNEETEA